LDPIVRELTMLTALACLGLGLAWAYDADYFAMAFAVAAAFSWGRGGSTVAVTSRRRPEGSIGPATAAIRVARTKTPGTRASEPLQSWRLRPCGSTTRAPAAFG
jgi:hypothetical protein